MTKPVLGLCAGLCLFFCAAGAIAADKPEGFLPPRSRVECDLQSVCIEWDFAQGDQGFTPGICEAGAVSVWQYGTTSYVPGAPGAVWGTILDDDYSNEAGDGLCSPAFTVTPSCDWMEIYHYYDIETNYDGGNVTVNGTVVPSVAGYDAVISTSTSYYAWCVDLEEGFTGHPAFWGTDCFDLSPYNGQEVVVCFDFGSDSSVTYPGWYIAWVKIGSTEPTATEKTGWGEIKKLFR